MTGTIIHGLKEEVVTTSDQIYALISAGEANRHIGATDFNELSSRSHTILRLVIESHDKENGSCTFEHTPCGRIVRGSTTSTARAPVRVAVLNLCDLAGSESARLTNAVGQRARVRTKMLM